MDSKVGSEVIAQLARNFAAARLRQQAAKDALYDYRRANGGCMEHHRREIDDAPYACFQASIPREEWCEVCVGSQGLWEVRRQTARDAGSAMQRLLRACRCES